MHSEQPVFFDPTGKRKRRVNRTAGVLALALMLLLASVAVSVLLQPHFAPPKLPAPAALKGLKADQAHAARLRAKKARAALERELRRAQRAKVVPVAPADTVSGAFYLPWRQAGLDSLRRHAGALSHVFPVWLRLSDDGRHIDTTDWQLVLNPRRADFEKIAREHGLKVFPVFANAREGAFSADSVAKMLADPQQAAELRNRLQRFVQDNDYQGLMVDFETLDTATWQRALPWLQALAADLHRNHHQLMLALEATLDDDILRQAGAIADYSLAMVYDEYGAGSTHAGPVASALFVEKGLSRFSRHITPSKLLLGLGSYGYDWNLDMPDQGGSSVSFSDVMSLARRVQPNVVEFDDVLLNPSLNYVDERGQRHEVWFQDAVTSYNARLIAQRHGIRHTALWALGMEDASTWAVLRPGPLPAPRQLEALPSPADVQFEGSGEVLAVAQAPQSGRRSLEVEPNTGLIADSQYQTYPLPFVIARMGEREGHIALTFDDGPDPRYTADILDILKAEGVPATFFVLGSAANAHPGLIRRMMAEGHELGSHSYSHPNMGMVSDERIKLELDATQTVIESITGRSVRLFRPPYNADAEPRSEEEVRPVVEANRLGYWVAGETIDTLDWYLDRIQPDGSRRRITPNDIVHSALAQLGEGSSVLLHDSGGDRTATVAALRPLIHALRARGYQFMTMGALTGFTPEQSMPPVPKDELVLAGVDRLAFGLFEGVDTVIATGFMLAIGLGFARVFLLTSLAVLKRRSPREIPAEDPAVDVLIAAYNEEKVIARTLESVLASRQCAVRIVVVDDGSRDGTAEVVRTQFGHDARVVLLQKPNGGKSSALNLALAHAHSEIVVTLDADTQLAPDAIAALAAAFDDPCIAAVAGNVEVGNRENLVTRWQSVEYTVSQQIDRSAYEQLNCITVVPGAIGAWRRTVLVDLGGYQSDTLAEDTDLTWRARRAGWRITQDLRAYAFTEAPNRIGNLFKQRFRWTYGTLQCLMKHRSALGKYGWFGWFALPSLWMLQVLVQLLAPFIDLQILWLVGQGVVRLIFGADHVDVTETGFFNAELLRVTAVWLAFLLVELLQGLLAYRYAGKPAWDVLLVPLQRLVYRQLLYLALWRSIRKALQGWAQGWGKLERSASVQVPKP